MKLTELFKGKIAIVITDMGVPVELEIVEVEERRNSEDLEPATRENDWWPASREWTTYIVHFKNGSSKTYRSLEEINIK